jgi:hypothetical protein
MISGPLLFAKYAFPPNTRGYCGPADDNALRDYVTAGVTDQGLTELARGFAGAWPYLELIATANGIADPLDAHVVEAYWIGNPLLDNVRVPALGSSAEERFRRVAGRDWDHVAGAVLGGAVPHHSFHVFCVYPWTGLLRSGHAEPSLQVLDHCRIAWAQVLTAPAEGTIIVRQQPLTWDGRDLALGAPEPRLVGAGFVASARPEDWVSVHWDTACDRLTASQLLALRAYTARHLRLVNTAAIASARP